MWRKKMLWTSLTNFRNTLCVYSRCPALCSTSCVWFSWSGMRPMFFWHFRVQSRIHTSPNKLSMEADQPVSVWMHPKVTMLYWDRIMPRSGLTWSIIHWFDLLKLKQPYPVDCHTHPSHSHLLQNDKWRNKVHLWCVCEMKVERRWRGKNAWEKS